MITTMRIGTRLILSFAIIIALLVGVGSYSLNRMHVLADHTTSLYEHPFTVRKSIRDAYLDLMKMNFTLNKMVSSQGSDAITADLQVIQDADKEFLKHMGVVRERFLGKQSEVDDVIKAY